MAWFDRFRARVRGFALGARVAFAALLGGAVPWLGRDPVRALPAASGGRTITGGEYQEGYYRVVIDWTPDEVKSAIVTSGTGYLLNGADLCTSMRGDDRIPPALSSRVLAVQAEPLTFEAAAAGRLRRRALKAAQAEEDWWDMFPESELEELRTWLRFFGVALGELVWTEADPADPTGVATIARIRHGRNVPRLKVWDSRHVRREMESGRWFVRCFDGHEEEILPGRGKWILLTTGGARPWLRAPWRGVADLWLAKKYAREDWAQQSERYADGIIGIESPEGADQDERDQLAADVDKAGKRPVMVWPSGYKARVLELAARAWETYKEQIELANRSIVIAILNNDLATESKKSAGTGAKLQGDVRDSVKAADAAADETALREQGLCPWALANFGDPELAPWPHYNVEPSEDVQALAVTWNLTAQALATADKAGIDVDLVEVRNATGFPIIGRKAVAPPPANDAPAPPPGIADAVHALVAKSGDLRAALEEVSTELGAALSSAELRVLSREPATTAAATLERLFAGYQAARQRAVLRSTALRRARAERTAEAA